LDPITAHGQTLKQTVNQVERGVVTRQTANTDGTLKCPM
jgi:hypothetical protein